MRAALYLPGQVPLSLDPEGLSFHFAPDSIPMIARLLECPAAKVEFLDTDQRTFAAYCVATETEQDGGEPAVEAMSVLRRISAMPEAYQTLTELGADVEDVDDPDRAPLTGPVLIVYASKFSCLNCGEQWAKHPATQVPCPDCQAPAGAVCRRPSGHEVPGGEVHVDREQAAVDAGLLTRCPAAGLGVATVPLRLAKDDTSPRYVQGSLFGVAA